MFVSKPAVAAPPPHELAESLRQTLARPIYNKTLRKEVGHREAAAMVEAFDADRPFPASAPG